MRKLRLVKWDAFSCGRGRGQGGESGFGCQATANAQYNQNGNDMSASKAVDGNDENAVVF